MWPVQSITQLSAFSGRPEGSYTSYGDSAILQATILFTVLTENSADDYPGMAPDDQVLANQGILAMADWIYLRFPYQQMIATPAMSENFMGYSYSKPPPIQVRNVQAVEIGATSTGVTLWDTAVQYLSKRQRASGVFYGQIDGMEHWAYDDQVKLLRKDKDGNLSLLGPADFNKIDFPGFMDINAQSFPMDPGV